jgi:hypothetical protein
MINAGEHRVNPDELLLTYIQLRTSPWFSAFRFLHSLLPQDSYESAEMVQQHENSLGQTERQRKTIYFKMYLSTEELLVWSRQTIGSDLIVQNS